MKAPGNSKAAEPIKTLNDVRRIIRHLKGYPRNRLLFIVGVNSPLRIGKLLKLKVGNVRNLKVGERFFFDPEDSKKRRYLEINRMILNGLQDYLKDKTLNDDDYLFCGREAKKPLVIQSVGPLIRKWTSSIGLTGNYGSETLRKTFGYIQRTVYGVGLDVLCDRFNHDAPAQTANLLEIDKNNSISIIYNKVG